MLVARGRAVSLVMQSGRIVTAPARAEILHDPDGRDWPEDAVLIAPFKHTGAPETRPSSAAKDHFKDQTILRGRIALPGRNMRLWREVGQVASIRYDFRGPHYAPEGHEHEFKRMPTLYRFGAFLRLEPIVTGPNGFRS